MERYRRADAVHTRLFDDELVVLDLERGDYFALDEIGTTLWTGLEDGKSLDEIARIVAASHDVSHERALSDLTALCEDLVARHLLVHERG